MRNPITIPVPGPRLLRLAAWVWTGIVFLLCVWPSDELPKSNIPLIDKWTHLILFGGFNFLWLLATRAKRRKQTILISVLSIFYGGILELLQSVFPSLGRSGDWLDAIADAIGVVLAALLYLLFCRLFPETYKRLTSD